MSSRPAAPVLVFNLLSLPDAATVHHRTDGAGDERQTQIAFRRFSKSTQSIFRITRVDWRIQRNLKEQIMIDSKIKMACHEHHLAAARHVAAADHHFQAVAEHEKGNHDEAVTHACAAQDQGSEAGQHATSAVGHCH